MERNTIIRKTEMEKGNEGERKRETKEKNGQAPENGSTSSFFSIRSGPGGILSGGSGVPSDCQNHGSGTVPHILHILYIMAYDTSSIWHMPYSAHPTYPLYMPYAISYILQFLFNAYSTYPAYPTYTLYGICHILHILHILDIMPYDTSSI